MEKKELERRAKISTKLKEYFGTEKGINHRNKLSQSQKNRMIEYNNYINNNRNK